MYFHGLNNRDNFFRGKPFKPLFHVDSVFVIPEAGAREGHLKRFNPGNFIYDTSTLLSTSIEVDIVVKTGGEGGWQCRLQTA